MLTLGTKSTTKTLNKDVFLVENYFLDLIKKIDKLRDHFCNFVKNKINVDFDSGKLLLFFFEKVDLFLVIID